MYKRIAKYLGVFIILFAAGGLITAKPCMAASADVELRADATEVIVGDNVFVYLTVDSDVMFGNFEANITYDDSVLEYIGGASVIKGDSGFLKISDMNVLDGDKSRKYTMKFEALKLGISDIAFSGAVKAYAFDTGNEMSVSSNEITLKVKAAATASTNANLKSLKISPTKLSPDFDPSVHEYNIKVGYETEQLVITAFPEDKKSTVSIMGNDVLAEGENKVIVSVLAESGAIIEYTINVFREYAPENSNVTPGPEQGTIEISTIDGESYIIYSGRYQLLTPDSSVIIPEGYQSAGLIIAGTKITAYVPTDDKTNDFILIYAVNASGEEGFYQYDKVEKTLQRYHPDRPIISDNDSTGETDATTMANEYNQNLRKAAVVIAILCAVSALAVFMAIYSLFKLRRKK